MIFFDDTENGTSGLLDVISIMLGYQNLVENRQQSAHNDVEKNNQKQAKMILDDLHAKFEEQNKTLEKQNHLLQEILNRLKGEKKNEL